jgi:hypothetical protein
MFDHSGAQCQWPTTVHTLTYNTGIYLPYIEDDSGDIDVCIKDRIVKKCQIPLTNYILYIFSSILFYDFKFLTPFMHIMSELAFNAFLYK